MFKKIVQLTFIIFGLSLGVYAQEESKEEEKEIKPLERLDQKNGFQGIVFGAHVNEYQDFVMLKSCSDDKAKVLGKGFDYVYLGDQHDSIAGVKINYLFLRTDKDNRIIEIGVYTDYDFDLTQATKHVFGKPTKIIPERWDYEEGKAVFGILIWESKNIRLHYSYKRYKKRSDNEKAPYPSYIFMRYLSLELERKINFEALQKEKEKFKGITDDF